MNIRPANASDAGAIAALVREFESVLVEDPDAAAPFWESMSEHAHAQNLASERFRYKVAESGGELLGFIAMRDGFHLFNLFVRRSRQRQGIARALWHSALRDVPRAPAGRGITVNASLDAVPVYRAFGFREVGAVVRTQGIAFVPMRWSLPPDAALAEQVRSD
jgi:GNAT superfamily N-acetyltransferase